jgi:GNAT superfamily N-acetyltransferase
MDYKIEKCGWKEYENFRSFCCVDTMPHPSGICYMIRPNVAFVGYNYPFMNNGARLEIWPEHTIMNRAINLTWLNRNVRCLSRVMVSPEKRGNGIAEYLIKHTINTVGVQYIECVTFTESIKHILENVGFVNYGELTTKKHDYFLYEVRNSIVFTSPLIPEKTVGKNST